MTTPTAPEESKEEEYDELPNNEATKYRASAARLNYLSTDRPDVQYASKEISKDMSKPTAKSVIKLDRVRRYLKYTDHRQKFTPPTSIRAASSWPATTRSVTR